MSVEKIKEIINEREVNYLSAHKTVITDNKTPEEIVMELYND
jgi:shikimate kinase